MSDRYRDRACQRLPCLALRIAALLVTAVVVRAEGSFAQGVFSQVPPGLTDAIRVDEPTPMVRTQLERVRINIAERQWDEAIESLRQLMENHGERLLRVDSRFISLRELGHRQLVALPAEGLALYRSRVDPQAQRWFDDGLKDRDAKLLARVVDELFASTYGDDALLALGDLALERGEYQTARASWERISPQLRAVDGQPLWLESRSKSSAPDEPELRTRELADGEDRPVETLWLAYPDTDLNLADVRARLVLASLMEGSRERAEHEYKMLVELHADSTGRLAGRDGPYRDRLGAVLESSKTWLPPPSHVVANTFAGDATRTFIAPGEFRLRGLAWTEPIALTPTPPPTLDITNRFHLPPRRVAEDAQALQSYHPLVTGDLVVFHDRERVYVYNLLTGRPAWQGAANTRPGQVYPSGAVGTSNAHASYAQVLGVPRFTSTVHGTYLFVRLGSQITSWSETNVPDKRGSLVVLDLAQQGKLIAELKPESDRWSFEGPPVCEGSRFYLAMRYNDVRPQAHVACYDLVANTGVAGTAYTPRLRWRRMVCAAESPARGSADEITHNLLSMAEGTLYLNTNLGAVASLSAVDGRIHWLTTYPRAQGGENNAHLFRDLNPCVYHRGTLYVAPTDSPQILALDATTGLLRWASQRALADVVHLLGVAQGSLIASGKQLWWLDAETGKALMKFPDSNEAIGFGRGMLIGDVVVWPTREELHVFFQKQAPSGDANAKPVAPSDPIRLKNYFDRITGGNLLAAGHYLLLASNDRIWAFGPKLDDNQMTKAK
jgi:hypothetical protein